MYLSLGKKPKFMVENEWDLLDYQAFVAIRLTLSKSVAFKIYIYKEHNMSLMATLTNMYEQPSTINKVYLIMKLFNLKMLENKNFKQHLN